MSSNICNYSTEYLPYICKVYVKALSVWKKNLSFLVFEIMLWIVWLPSSKTYFMVLFLWFEMFTNLINLIYILPGMFILMKRAFHINLFLSFSMFTNLINLICILPTWYLTNCFKIVLVLIQKFVRAYNLAPFTNSWSTCSNNE